MKIEPLASIQLWHISVGHSQKWKQLRMLAYLSPLVGFLAIPRILPLLLRVGSHGVPSSGCFLLLNVCLPCWFTGHVQLALATLLLSAVLSLKFCDPLCCPVSRSTHPRQQFWSGMCTQDGEVSQASIIHYLVTLRFAVAICSCCSNESTTFNMIAPTRR